MEEEGRAGHRDTSRHQARHEAQVVLVHHIGSLDLAQDTVRGRTVTLKRGISRSRQTDDANVGDDVLPWQAAGHVTDDIAVQGQDGDLMATRCLAFGDALHIPLDPAMHRRIAAGDVEDLHEGGVSRSMIDVRPMVGEPAVSTTTRTRVPPNTVPPDTTSACAGPGSALEPGRRVVLAGGLVELGGGLDLPLRP